MLLLLPFVKLFIVISIVSNRRCVVHSLDDSDNNKIEQIVRSIQECDPCVTLSFAQTLDGKIGYYYYHEDDDQQLSSNLPISSKESLIMTHALRSIHDAILVGGRTLATDNPRLSNRLWLSAESTGSQQKQQPRPVVLDTNLKYIRMLLQSPSSGGLRAKNVIVCCSEQAAIESNEDDTLVKLCNDDQGIELLSCRTLPDGHLDLDHVVLRLREKHGIRSIMVEGGSGVLTAFASADLADCVCITISPKLMGQQNSVPSFAAAIPTNTEYPWRDLGSTAHYSLLGGDIIMVSRWR